MTNKELQEELKKHPNDSLILRCSDHGDFPLKKVAFSNELPRNAIHFNMLNPYRIHYITLD
jgi:hypothetical protein